MWSLYIKLTVHSWTFRFEIVFFSTLPLFNFPLPSSHFLLNSFLRIQSLKLFVFDFFNEAFVWFVAFLHVISVDLIFPFQCTLASSFDGCHFIIFLFLSWLFFTFQVTDFLFKGLVILLVSLSSVFTSLSLSFFIVQVVHVLVVLLLFGHPAIMVGVSATPKLCSFATLHSSSASVEPLEFPTLIHPSLWRFFAHLHWIIFTIVSIVLYLLIWVISEFLKKVSPILISLVPKPSLHILLKALLILLHLLSSFPILDAVLIFILDLVSYFFNTVGSVAGCIPGFLEESHV